MKTILIIFFIITLYTAKVFSFTTPFFHNKGSVFALEKRGSVKDEEFFAHQRKRMVKEQLVSRGIKDKRVLEAMETVPRHLFIPEERRSLSYSDQPVPIGFGQTISQPYIVAYMTELLTLDKDNTVLEIGTGSGYQAAILSELVKEIYTIEVVEKLGRETMEKLESMGYTNVNVKIGDGYKGWPEHAPFDRIIVTAAAKYIPQPLIDQLKPGGRMIIPVGGVYEIQDLMLITKDASSNITKKSLAPVSFVPLIRK
ncbi:MAG: protein-L-isoaspartate(D-aspartate) O-methyltransferase [wastewater metagenome]|nr:protein-L-isoaspartate(D-aspartate) O-methyltransferase [Candidatus Loosdrechtia aerotolerans]